MTGTITAGDGDFSAAACILGMVGRFLRGLEEENNRPATMKCVCMCVGFHLNLHAGERNVSSVDILFDCGR